MQVINSIQQFAMTLDESSGPVCFPAPADLRAVSEREIDLSQLTERGEVGFLSGVFVNNWDNAKAVSISNNDTKQEIIFPANSYGYMPILSPNPPKFVIKTTDGTPLGKFIVPIFYNSPIMPVIVKQ